MHRSSTPRRPDPLGPDPGASDAAGREPIVIDVGPGLDGRSPRRVGLLIAAMMVIAALLTIAGFHLMRPAGWLP